MSKPSYLCEMRHDSSQCLFWLKLYSMAISKCVAAQCCCSCFANSTDCLDDRIAGTHVVSMDNGLDVVVVVFTVAASDDRPDKCWAEAVSSPSQTFFCHLFFIIFHPTHPTSLLMPPLFLFVLGSKPSVLISPLYQLPILHACKHMTIIALSHSQIYTYASLHLSQLLLFHTTSR